MTHVLGLDVGGTRLRAVVVDEAGTPVWKRTELVDRSPSRREGEFDQLVEISRLAEEDSGVALAAIGVASTGPLDVAAGTVENPFTLPPALNGPLVARLQAAREMPVALLNDATAAAVGETWLGAGRGGDLVVAVTLGTGIGVGVVRRLRPVLGAGGWDPEAGHQVLDPSGPPCYCGARGCWEQLCAGPALARAMTARVGAPGSEGEWTGAAVGEAARAGDADARAVLEDAAHWLGIGLVNVLAFLGPDVIVLAGGVAESAEEFLRIPAEILARHAYHRPERVALRVAELGDLAGAYGAARAAHDRAAAMGPEGAQAS